MDEKQSSVLLKLVVNLPKALGQTIVHAVNPKHLQRTEDLLKSKNLSIEEPEEPDKPKGKKVPSWLLGDNDSSVVIVETQWQKLLSNTDDVNKVMWLKSRVGICLETLASLVPSYSDKDLLLCHRKSSKGVWRDELWTLRSFKAEELIFAPLVSQIRQSHLVTPYNLPIGTPVSGPGAHPEQASLALDGRMRQTLAKEGVIDAQKHMGSSSS